ncbi:MAG: bifunctional diaminohydroxyphosphoribosylaminopyrimidine deaminase/5-amino-6-(5-phosphoribosylamino)uracil reductase RibD [Paludibacteraceae bacterium]|nr:bifunctional diaminohydroxyphosphoribosylaminopyrimidine deaminase/5-amino-6-(5-phosphoribosylamino)uracil reductase RibD [Paludibacteraceae bacterium]
MTTEQKTDFMRRCLQLARLGMGHVAPNPMVGCVVVVGNRIVAEGWHRQFGGPHAEVNALNALADKSILRDATLFVNLEPCSHYGKTPPCALRLINDGVRRVVICNLDPNPQVAGRGVAMLREAGVEVETGLLEAEGWQLNRRFFTYHTLHRPYITLKWAQSADGYLDGNGDKPVRISTDLTKALVHKMRAEEMAILVGTRTALKDNPQLHTRRWFGPHPTRVVFDRNLSVPSDAHLLSDDQPTLIFNAVKEEAPRYVKIDFEGDTLSALMSALYERSIQSLIVEGGRDTLQRFIERDLFDAVQIEVGDCYCGEGTPAPVWPNVRWEVCRYGTHLMYHYQKPLACHSS